MTDEINAKLDKIITLLEKKSPGEDVKQEIINYMLKHFNIMWVNDEIEADAYRTILDFVFSKVL